MHLLNQYIGRFLAIVFTPFARIWSFMRRVIPGLKRLPTLRPETLAALLSFVLVLTIVVVHFLIVFVFKRDDVSQPYTRTIVPLILINIAMPIVLYFGVRILLAPPKSPFPDIDLAFQAGVDALEKNGISLKDTPVYLVIGTPEPKMIKQMMEASQRTFDVSHVTSDGQALHWYGSADNTYVFLTGIGNVCQLTKDLSKYVSQSSPDQGQESGSAFTGTIDVRALGKGKPAIPSPVDEADVADVSSGDGFKATIKAGELGQEQTPQTQRSQPLKETRPANNKQLSSREKLANQKRRITHFCQLLTRHRSPVCALNGIIVGMANRLVEEFPGELARQIKSDLTSISQTTGVVTTVTAIITGFETDEGCREFISRLREIKGEEFLSRRFGKSYRSWEAPTADHLKEISNESIENFDQYIYSIFTQHDALSSRHVIGNRDMVKFLCWIYAQFYEGLELTLTSGFNTEENGDAPRFAGCYFMGVGDSPDRQFFSEGVFDRVDENQGELEWTRRVLQREETLSLVSQLVFLAGLLALAVFIFLFVQSSWSTDVESALRLFVDGFSQPLV